MVTVDRRFGSWNEFGTSNTFGASTFDASLAWGFEVDWDGDGVFDGSNETLRVCGFTSKRGRTSMLKSTGEGYESIPTGQAVITLWNDDGRYDAWNSASPLYPNVTRGKEVRIRVRDLTASSETIDNVFYGVIADILPMYGERPKVNIYVDDGFSRLRNKARVALQTGITVDTAIGAVLDAVNWSSRWGRSLAVSGDTIPYFYGSGDRSAADECESLANSFLGNFFIAADGSARYITRTTIGSSVADFDQSEASKDIRNPQPWENYRNVVRLTTHVRNSTGSALLYEQFGDAVSIASGETLTDFVSLTFNGASVPALSLDTPVANVDYTINSAANGSGSDVSGSCTVTVTRLGDRAKRVIVNSSGATAYVTSFQITGEAIYERNVSDVYYPRDPTTVDDPSEFFMDLPWQQNVNTAISFADLLGPFLAGQHPFPVIEIESNYSKQFPIELFDVVTFTSNKLGIGGRSFRVGAIEHASLDESLQRFKTSFYLEPYIASGDYGEFPFTWGTSTFGW